MVTPAKPSSGQFATAEWGGLVHDKVFTFGWWTGTLSTDTAAWFQIPAANFGLATIAGAVASAVISTGGNSVTDTYFASEVQPRGDFLAVSGRVSQIWLPGGAGTFAPNWGFGASRSFKVYAFAWGTPATLLSDFADDDRPELTPQEDQ